MSPPTHQMPPTNTRFNLGRGKSAKHLCLLVFQIVLVAFISHSVLGQEAKLFPKASSDQIVTLFPAKNLDAFEVRHWRGRKWKPNKDVKRIFKLQDGSLKASGNEVLYLNTKRKFHNYHLIAEYKWLSSQKPRDSGIFVNATPVGPAIMALECNITAAPTKAFQFGLWGVGPTRQLIVDGRKISSVPRPSGKDIEKPVGQWNRVEIICDRDRFVYSVNGRQIVSGTNPVPRSGSVMFQHNKGDILFRRVQIVDYDALSSEDAAKARSWQK